MTRTPVTPFLRFALLVDAGVSGATAVLLVVAAVPLAALLHLPEALLFNVGLVLVPYVVVVGWLGSRHDLARTAVWAVIACNVVWAIDSCWLLVSGLVAPNAFGVSFVIVQAVAVLVFAELQFTALRRSRLAA